MFFNEDLKKEIWIYVTCFNVERDACFKATAFGFEKRTFADADFSNK